MRQVGSGTVDGEVSSILVAMKQRGRSLHSVYLAYPVGRPYTRCFALVERILVPEIVVGQEARRHTWPPGEDDEG